MSTLPLRNIISGALALSMAVALAGCGDSSGTTTESTVTITSPGIVGPNAASPAPSAQPTLTVTNVSVSDGSTAPYTFQIATDEAFQSILRQTTGVAQGSAQTTWTPDTLATGAYFWRARGVAGGSDGPWSQVAQFLISSGPDAGPGENVLVFDALTDGTTMGVQNGGSLTQNGWRINTNSDFLRYEVPSVSNGYVQWQNLGLTPRGANDASHMLMGMWDPAAGPYRQNPFRVHVQKLWANPHNPPFMRLRFISQGREHDAGANFTNWNPGQVYTWRLDWGPGAGVNRARVFLDGIEVMGIQYNRAYNPQTHFIELGIGERGESVLDAIYRNFTVVSRN